MKLLIVGGGGFRVPQVLSVLTDPDLPIRLTEVCLYDVDASRLAVMKAALTQLEEALPPIRTTTDLEQAVRGSSFIFSAMRIGGTCGRVLDERIALERGVLGQETVGVGGYAYALRTIPEAMRLARAVASLAPEAWVINFTNPAGIITQAMRTIYPRVVGICDTPIGLVRRAELFSGIGPGADYDYVGLNHLGWLRSLGTGGHNVLPDLLADDEALSRFEEARIIGLDWVRALGALPNEYLYYYYRNRESVASISSGQTRGEFLDAQQSRFYAEATDHLDRAGELWRASKDEREATYMAEARADGEERAEEDMGGGYEHVALAIMTALTTGQAATMILGVANSDAGGDLLIPQLREDAVIEVPATVDASGIHPHRVAPLTGPELGLVTSVKACEELIVDAGLHGDKALAWRAFASHPLVDSVAVAKDILEAYISANPDVTRTFA